MGAKGSGESGEWKVGNEPRKWSREKIEDGGWQRLETAEAR
jgi:hypothetical protein